MKHREDEVKNGQIRFFLRVNFFVAMFVVVVVLSFDDIGTKRD